MRLYLEVARRGFRRHLIYRAAALAGLFTNSVFGVMLASVYLAFYRDQGQDASVAGFTVTEALIYIWTGQALIAIIAVWGWWDIAALIRSGDIVTDLMKPLNYYAYWLSHDLGRAASQVLLRGIPTFAVGLILYDLGVSTAPDRWFAFAVSVVLAVIVSFAWRFLLNLATFWLLDWRGISSLAMITVTFLSGFLIPLPFFPDWLRLLAEALPFRAMVMLPVEVLLGHGSIAAALAIQAAWAVAMSLLCLGLLNVAVRKVVIQGG